MLEVIKINNSSIGMRIDRWIKVNLTKIPQSLIEKDLRNGKIKVNKKKIRSSYKLNKFDQIYLYNISYKNLIKSRTGFIPKNTIIRDNSSSRLNFFLLLRLLEIEFLIFSLNKLVSEARLIY